LTYNADRVIRHMAAASDVFQSDKRDLERVFNYMCNFQKKIKHINDIRKQKKILKEYRSHLQRAKGHEVMYDTMDPKDVDKQISAANNALEDAENKIQEINESGIDKISDLDLSLLLRDLGHPASLATVRDMIWEVDENLDEHVDWNEFRTMYQRNVLDKTGIEPSKLYHLVQFMVYDDDYNKSVSVDETMTFLFHRYGKRGMDVVLRELFGDRPNDGGKKLNFSQYVKAVARKLPKRGKKSTLARKDLLLSMLKK